MLLYCSLLLAQEPDLSKIPSAEGKIKAWTEYCEILRLNGNSAPDNFVKLSAGVDFADSTLLTGLDFFAIGDVVSVFFDLVGLLIPKFFVPFVSVLTSGRIFQNFSASSRVTRAR